MAVQECGSAVDVTAVLAGLRPTLHSVYVFNGLLGDFELAAVYSDATEAEQLKDALLARDSKLSVTVVPETIAAIKERLWKREVERATSTLRAQCNMAASALVLANVAAGGHG